MTNPPPWLAAKIAANTRRAQHHPCPDCGADVWTGLDLDRGGFIVDVDAQPHTIWTLNPVNGGHELHRQWPEGYLEHECDGGK